MKMLGGEPELRSRTVALTFDDGPGPKTAALARMLLENQVRATFFVLGENLDGYENEFKTCVECGHKIALHGFTHEAFTDSQIAVRELDDCANRISKIAPNILHSRMFRPPFGHWAANRPQLQNYAGPIGWHADGGDWHITFRQNRNGTATAPLHSPEACVREILQQLGKRDFSGIVLLHDFCCKKEALQHHVSAEHIKIVEITSHLIDELKKQNVSFVAL